MCGVIRDRPRRAYNMNIIDEPLLDAFRSKRRCELCLEKISGAEPHHVYGKGMGGARRFDVRINLIALCTECHHAFHYGRIERAEMLEVVAAREKTTPQAIEEAIWQLRRA